MYRSLCEWSPVSDPLQLLQAVSPALPESCQTNQSTRHQLYSLQPSRGRGLSGRSFQYRGGRAHCEQDETEEICWTGQSHGRTPEIQRSNHHHVANRDLELHRRCRADPVMPQTRNYSPCLQGQKQGPPQCKQL